MQSVQGYSAMDTGLALLPQGIVIGIGIGIGVGDFNIVQWLSGSAGISALATIFQTQAAGYAADALSGYPVNAGAMHVGQGASAIASLPSAARDAVGTAVIRGFHDAVWVLFGLSVVGLALAFFLKDNRDKQAAGARLPVNSDPCSQ
jgi:hypothetical protein